MALISYFAGGIKQTKPTRNIEPAEAIQMVKSGRFRIETDKYRASTNAALKEVMKQSFPYVTWSGTFKKRETKGLIEHSGLICLDADHIYHGTEEEMYSQSLEFKKKISQLKYCFASFRSPTDGEKIIIRINPKKHAAAFTPMQHLFLEVFKIELDEKCTDIPRACFLCDDPSAYINEQCATFNPSDLADSADADQKKKQPVPAGDFDKQFKKAEKWAKEKGGDYAPDNHNNFAYLFACQCNRLGVPEDHTQQYALVAFTEIPEKELAATINSAYKNHPDEHAKLNKKKTIPAPNAGNAGAAVPTVPDQSAVESNKGDDADEELISDSKSKKITKGPFWIRTYEKKTTKNIISIDNEEYINYLNKHGFICQRVPKKGAPDTYQVIHKQGNIIQPMDRPNIIQWFNRHKNEINLPKSVRNRLIGSAKTYFSYEIFNFLPAEEIVFKRDTREAAFLYFQNCYVKITATSIGIHHYTELDVPIWKEQVIPRNFNLNNSYRNSEFFKFIQLACTGKEDLNPDAQEDQSLLQNLASLMTGIGYMLHGYKDRSRSWSFDLFDSKMRGKKDADGRSGKTLLFQLLAHVKPIVQIECRGKQYNEIVKPENFNAVNYHTSIIVFNDVPPGFPYDIIFPFVTEGVTIKRLYADEFNIPYELSPKIAVISNHTLKGRGGSYTGRQKNFEFTDFFRDGYSPADYFGHILGQDWNQDQWDLFYSTCIHCIQYYLQDGVIPFLGKYEYNKLANDVPEEFLDWADGLLVETEYKKREMIEDLQIKTEIKVQSSQIFKSWLQDYCDFKGLDINAHITKVTKSGFRTDKRGGDEYIILTERKGKQESLFDQNTAA